MTKYKLSLTAAIASLLVANGIVTHASAQTSAACNPLATSCTNSTQTSGDTNNQSSATNTKTDSSQSGVSSASNASGATVDPSFDNRAQTTQNATNTTTGTISGGNTNSAANGNQSSNANQSSVGNTTTGPSSATSGGNTLSTGSSTATNTAGGGSVGNTTAAGGQSTASSTGTNAQGQQQGQNSATTGTNTSQVTGGAQTLTGGTQASTSSQSLGASGNSQTNVDASDRSVSNYSEVFIPPVVPPTPPSSLAVGQIVKETSACGPMQAVRRVPVTGVFFGLIFRQKIEQGFTEELVPYVDATGRAQMYIDVPLSTGEGFTRYGHQVTQTTTVIGTAGARNIALGGGGGNNSWGQAGGGATSSMQQLVTTLQLRACEVGTFRERAVTLRSYDQPPAGPPVVEVPPKHIRG